MDCTTTGIGSRLCSAATDSVQKFLSRWHVPGLPLGEHEFAVGEYVQHAAASQAQLYLFDSGLLLQFAFQAPGLMPNVGSKKTALDLDLHACPHPVRCGRQEPVVRSQEIVRSAHPLILSADS